MRTALRLIVFSAACVGFNQLTHAQSTAVPTGTSLSASTSRPFVLNQYLNAVPICQDPFRFFLGGSNDTSAQAVANVKFSNAVGSISSRGVWSQGEPLTVKGYMVGVGSQTEVDNSSNHRATAYGELARSGGYALSGTQTGVRGNAYAEKLATFNSGATSIAIGGLFEGGRSTTGADLQLTGSGVGTYWIGGMMGRLRGELNTPLPQGVYSGVIGLDLATPGPGVTTYAGYFDGTVHSTGDVTAPSFTVTSSRRWKEDVRTLEAPLDLVNGLRGVRYVWSSSGEEQVGFIAEEVAEVLPEVVTLEDDGVTARGVEYSRITAVLVEAVQDQQAQIQALRLELEALREEKSER